MSAATVVKKSEIDDLLTELLSHVPYAVAVFDTQMRYLAYSRQWLSAYHLEDHDIVGCSLYELTPEICPQWRQIHQDCLEGAEHRIEDAPFLRADGSVDYISWLIRPWRREDGSIGGLIIYTRLNSEQTDDAGGSQDFRQELQILLETSRAVPWRFDLTNRRFIYVGPRLTSLLGYDTNTWHTLDDWASVLHPDDREQAVALCLEKSLTGEAHDFEYRAFTASGEMVWIRTLVSVIKNDEGQVSELAGLFIDVSEQKRAELELRRSESQFRSVIEASGDGFCLTDARGFLLHANDAYARLTGYEKDEMVGMHISDFEAEEDPEDTARHIEKVIANGSDLFETRHRRKSGEIRDVEISISYTPDAGGRFFVLVRDITESKKTRQKLRLIETVFNNTSEGIVITDPNGVIIDVNPAYCEITGYSRDEMIGERPNKIKSDRHDDAFYRGMWNALVTDGRWVGEIWDRRKNGEVFPKWLNINAVRDEKNALTHYVGTFSDISVLKGIEQKLEYMAYFDPLTGLPNRILFKDRLENQISNCFRYKKSCAVLFLDLDRFKLINDTLGHSTGDKLLIEAANRLKHCIRDSDTVARFGGDEFTILLSGLKGSDGAAMVAQHIVNTMRQPMVLQGVELHISTSIGIAMYPDDGDNFTTLTRHADAAMYEAKRRGRGQYHFFSEEMDESAHEHLTIERELHRALDEHQFFLVYQPQVDVETGKATRCEALIRWRHPERGIVSPDNFIHIAEENGLIHPIGEWVIREVCRQIAQWRKAGVTVPIVAVNLSARQFRDHKLIEKITTILEQTGIGSDAIEFEITESVAMEDAETTLQRLSELNALGFSIAIDDFGTGYSSLSYLKRFPVDKLKLDRSFVMDIHSDPNDAAIAAAIIHMAKILELSVVAEGVETVEQKEYLVDQGCHFMQGYLFSKPLTGEQFLTYLDAS